MKPITYPARPINGGRFDLAPEKRGDWYYEPKYNGWRVLLHVPTGTCFNRHGQPLSIADEFQEAIANIQYVDLMRPQFEWLDCEGIARRHNLAQGALVLLDWVTPDLPYVDRKNALHHRFGVHQYQDEPEPMEVYVAPSMRSELLPSVSISPRKLWDELQEFNHRYGVPFYEGLVAKRGDKPYPIQLDSPDHHCTHWVKHRFDQ
jgi:ATP-dependent DNA ligase